MTKLYLFNVLDTRAKLRITGGAGQGDGTRSRLEIIFSVCEDFQSTGKTFLS